MWCVARWLSMSQCLSSQRTEWSDPVCQRECFRGNSPTPKNHHVLLQSKFQNNFPSSFSSKTNFQVCLLTSSMVALSSALPSPATGVLRSHSDSTKAILKYHSFIRPLTLFHCYFTFPVVEFILQISHRSQYPEKPIENPADWAWGQHPRWQNETA